MRKSISSNARPQEHLYTESISSKKILCLLARQLVVVRSCSNFAGRPLSLNTRKKESNKDMNKKGRVLLEDLLPQAVTKEQTHNHDIKVPPKIRCVEEVPEQKVYHLESLNS